MLQKSFMPRKSVNRDGRFLRRNAIAVVMIGVALCLAALSALADDLLGGLAKPQEGRSMRASSSFREGAGGKYDPKAPFKGDLEEKSNWDNFSVAPGATHVL